MSLRRPRWDLVARLEGVFSQLLVDAGIRPDLASTADGEGGWLVAGVARVLSSVEEMAAYAMTLRAGQTVETLGYYAANDGGGGIFEWDATSTATPIQGVIVQRDSGGVGRWIRVHNGTLTTRQTGAKIDNVTFDDAALKALQNYVSTYDDCRHLVLDPGTYRILINDGSTPGDLFSLTGIDGLLIDADGAIFNVEIAQTETRSNLAVFNFDNCRGTKIRGLLTFTAVNGFTPAYMIANGVVAGKGTIGVQFKNDCSFSEAEADADGILMPVNWVRAPRLTVHPFRTIRIVAAGSGYTVGDTLTLSNVGPPTGVAVAATTNATFTVATIDGSGGVTGLTRVNRGVFPATGDIGLNVADIGWPLTGGTGTGAIIVPYLADYDLELFNADPATGSGHSRQCTCKVKARNCYYGFHANYSFSDGHFESDTDYVYRGAVIYGGQEGVTFRIHNRHSRGDSFAGGSSKGLGSDVRGHFTQLPCMDTTFNSQASSARVVYTHGLPAVCDWRLDFSVDTGYGASATDNYYGTLFEVDKSALNGSDTTHARGHVGTFELGGLVNGVGRLDSGLGAYSLFGTNVNIPAAAWTGEEFHWTIKDGFRHFGGGLIVINAKCLGSLTIGRIQSNGPVTTDVTATAAITATALAPTGPISLNRDATFLNRHTVAGGYAPCMGDIILTANCTLGKYLSGHRFHTGSGTGTTITVELPAAETGHRWEFMNGITTASSEVHISPNGTDWIRDGSTVNAGGKNWRLTGLSAFVELRAFRSQILSIVNSYGTQSIEP